MVTNISLISKVSKNFAILGSKLVDSTGTLYVPSVLGNDQSFLKATTGVSGGNAANVMVAGLLESDVNTEFADINANFLTLSTYLGLTILP